MERNQQRDISFKTILPGLLSILVFIFLFAGMTTSLSAENVSLNRLFYSPEDRAYLDSLRESASRTVPVVAEPTEPAEKEQDKARTFTLSGTLTTKDGVKSIWLNDQPYSSANLPENIAVQKPYNAGQVDLLIPERGRSYSLRPGQTLYLGDEQIRESYERPPAPEAMDPATARKENADTPAPLTAVEGDSSVRP